MSLDEDERVDRAMDDLRRVFLEKIRRREPVTIVDEDGSLCTYEPNPSKGEDNWRRNTSYGERSRNDVEDVRDEVRRARGYVIDRKGT